jgi:hypothetical protein
MNHSFTGIICSINPFMSSGAHNMLLRRFILHVRQQQWFAVTLDLVVVVLGVFVAFQVDRWYEAQQAESRALAHFDSLAADFAQNRERLLKAIGYADRQISAALALRNEARRAEAVLSIPELNRLYSETSGLPTFEAVDFAYRNLINSGELAGIKDLELRERLAEFYASYELTKVMQTTQELQYVNVIQPYTIRNLDYAASGRPGSATETERQSLEPLINPGLILEAMRTKEFENIVVAQWERAIDMRSNYRELLDSVTHIQAILEKQK